MNEMDAWRQREQMKESMTLDEAILHCEEVADRCAVTDGSQKCETEHRQLAKWLRELKERRSYVQPKRGRWIYGEDEYGIDGYHCDKCGFFVPWDYTHTFINYITDYNFCPSCGAEMSEGGQHEAN